MNAQKKREEGRIGGINALVKRKDLTGSTLQKEVTKLAEQVIMELFDDCSRGGTPPADFAIMACGSVARREMVAFSDIDALLVTSSDDRKTQAYFEDLAMRMNHRLQTVGTRITRESSGHMFVGNSGFVFCPGGGLTPEKYHHMPQTIVNYVLEDSANDAHVRGALFPRFIYGSPILGKVYSDLCEQALKTGAGNAKAGALEALRQLVPRRHSDLTEAKKGDTMINLKTSIYRATQLIPNEIAIYYGITAMGTREQIVRLVETRNMSMEVANVFMETLEVYAKVMTAVQLKAGQEQQQVRTVDFPSSDPRQAAIKLDPQQLAAIHSCMPRVALMWQLAESFHFEKSKGGRFTTKKNPFTSTNPWSQMGVSRS